MKTRRSDCQIEETLSLNTLTIVSGPGQVFWAKKKKQKLTVFIAL